MSWETVIGLEIHAQLLTNTKLFCPCAISFGEEPNTRSCPVCLGLPGSLPVLNEEAIRLAVKAAASIHSRINPESVFARKNYFYPDLPKGYQISQFDRPLAEGGYIEISAGGKNKRIGITRLHLEEDAGKLLHEGGGDSSIIDYNRSCVPLIEVVSEPEISSPEEASEYLKILRLVLVYNGISDGNMELGNLRCDANISVRKSGSAALGTKTELKNMNSFNFIAKALDYEVRRHIEILEKGGRIKQETLLWDRSAEKTVPMRSKEEAHDYRYFPEPDLLPLRIEESAIKKISTDEGIVFSETLLERVKDMTTAKKIPATQAETIVNNPVHWELFTASSEIYDKNQARSASIISIIIPAIKEADKRKGLLPGIIAAAVRAEDEGKTSMKMTKEIIEEAIRTGRDVKDVISSKGVQITSGSELDAYIDRVLEGSRSEVETYKSGKEGLFNFLLGKVMKESKGKANPKLASDRLKEKLKG